MNRKFKPPIFSVFLCTLLIFFISSTLNTGCNSKKEDKQAATGDTTQTEKDDDKTANGETTEKAQLGINLDGNGMPFYTVILERDTLKKLLLENNSIRKLVFTTYDADSAALSLVVYGATQNNNYYTRAFHLKIVTGVIKNLNAPLQMSDQELSFKELKRIMDIRGQFDTSKLVSLKFEPNREELKKCLVYFVTGTTGAAGSGSTNPSPPYTPCTGGACE